MGEEGRGGGEGKGRVVVMRWFSKSRTSFFGSRVGTGLSGTC